MALRVTTLPMSDRIPDSQENLGLNTPPDPKKPEKKRARLPAWSTRNGLWSWILFGVGLILLVSVYSKPELAAKEIPYSEFRAKIKAGEIQQVILSPTLVKGFSSPQGQKATALFVSIPVEDSKLIELMEAQGIRYEQENVALKNLFLHWVLPFLVLLVLWRFVFARAFKVGPGAGFMSFGKNRAKLVSEDSKKVVFSDVAGCDEAKEEL
ncbi:hypothetical protein EBR78_10255, partial [bacterium]|nr:hypothetical protein [bacterium]